MLAAADLQPVMPALAEAYEHATGIKLVVSYGSSSTLATQILNGDPADIFLGADYSFPEKIVAAGLADDDGADSLRAGHAGAVGAEGFAAAAAEHGYADRPAGEDDCDCERAACAVWARRGERADVR